MTRRGDDASPELWGVVAPSPGHPVTASARVGEGVTFIPLIYDQGRDPSSPTGAWLSATTGASIGHDPINSPGSNKALGGSYVRKKLEAA